MVLGCFWSWKVFIRDFFGSKWRRGESYVFNFSRRSSHLQGGKVSSLWQSHASSALWLVDIPTSTCETHVYRGLGYLIIKLTHVTSPPPHLRNTSVQESCSWQDCLYLPCTVEVGEGEQEICSASTTNKHQHSWHFTIKFLTFYRPKKSETSF